MKIEIDTLKGRKDGFPKTYLGYTTDGMHVAVMYDNYFLTVRLAKNSDPRYGLIVAEVYVPEAKQHDIADVRMVERLEQAGVSFKGRRRVIAVSSWRG